MMKKLGLLAFILGLVIAFASAGHGLHHRRRQR